MELAILIFGLVINFSVGLFVLLRNVTNKVNRALFALSIFLCIWLMANFFADKTSALTLLWNRGTFIGPLLFLYFADLFIHRLRANQDPSNSRLFLLGSLLFCSFALSPWVIRGVTPRYSGHSIVGYDVVRGTGYFFLIAWITYLLLRFLFHLWRAYKEAVGALKKQLNVILIGIVSAAILGLITNIFLPLVSGTTASAKLAPLTSVLIMGAFGIAIVKHKLFDLHFFVVRTVAYMVTLLLLLVAYIVPAVLIVGGVYGVHIDRGGLIAGVTVSLFMALLYPYVVKLFNALTSKVFFRNMYDPKAILDTLSDMLVRTIDAAAIQRESINILQEALRTESLEYLLLTDDDQRILHMVAKAAAKSSKDNLLIVDEWKGDAELVAKLRAEGIAAVVQLRTHHEDLGFLTVGYKRSGQPFNVNDKYLLRIAADSIALSLQNALRFQQIQHFNRLLRERVDEATRELRHSNAKLRAMDETKDDFISMASHQLRTPLTSVKGYLSMVLEGDAGKLTPLQKQMLGQAYISSQRMVYLIADLLNVSRLKTGKFVIEAHPVNLSTMIEEEVRQLVETAKSRELTLSYKKPATFPELMLDETKIRQVVMNFIDNAIYYTPAGGRITVELLDKASSIEVHVTDNGIGVPKSEQHHLFTKFYRAQNARRARPDGTGLGLFMAKKVVAAQGGAIIFESQEGKGSTFGFTFSKSKLAVPATPAASETASASLAK